MRSAPLPTDLTTLATQLTGELHFDHAMRALYIARANGIEAVAFPAKDLSMVGGLRTHVRESLARVRTLLDVHVLGRKPHFLGTAIEIGKNG